MNYKMRNTLEVDQNPNGSYEVEHEPFLVAEDSLAEEWIEGQSSYGEEYHRLYPAFVKDVGRCWLHEWEWQSEGPYCATGYGSELYDFQKGCIKLIELGKFEFPLPASERQEELEQKQTYLREPRWEGSLPGRSPCVKR